MNALPCGAGTARAGRCDCPGSNNEFDPAGLDAQAFVAWEASGYYSHCCGKVLAGSGAFNLNG